MQKNCEILLQRSSLTNLSAVAEGLGRGYETHLAVVLTRHEDHSLGLDATDLAWSEVGQDAYLLANHLLRRVLLSNS